MAKWVAPEILDAALARIAAADRMIALHGQPDSFEGAMAAALASVVMGPGDFQLASGPGQARRVTVAGREAVPVGLGGTAAHVALVNAAEQRILYVTTCPETPVMAGGSVTFEPWTVEIGGPQ